MSTMRREKIIPHFFSSLSHMTMNVTTDCDIKFGEKLGRNWEEKI